MHAQKQDWDAKLPYTKDGLYRATPKQDANRKYSRARIATGIQRNHRVFAVTCGMTERGYIGCFRRIEDAVAARCEAEMERGWAPPNPTVEGETFAERLDYCKAVLGQQEGARDV